MTPVYAVFTATVNLVNLIFTFDLNLNKLYALPQREYEFYARVKQEVEATCIFTLVVKPNKRWKSAYLRL